MLCLELNPAEFHMSTDANLPISTEYGAHISSVEASAFTVIDITIRGEEVLIKRHGSGVAAIYAVWRAGVNRHGRCSAEEAMCALAFYAHQEPAITAP